MVVVLVPFWLHFLSEKRKSKHMSCVQPYTLNVWINSPIFMEPSTDLVTMEVEAVSTAICNNNMANIQSCETRVTLISLNVGSSSFKYGNRSLKKICGQTINSRIDVIVQGQFGIQTKCSEFLWAHVMTDMNWQEESFSSSVYP